MTAITGKLASSYTAGELDPRVLERPELKYFNQGLATAANIVVFAQGGFALRDGLRRIGTVPNDAQRLKSFAASDGAAYDLVFCHEDAEVWGTSAKLDTVVLPYQLAQLAQLTFWQAQDTLLVFHPDVETRRVKHLGPTNWQVDTAPLTNIPTWDYGGPIGGGSYTNGEAAVWELEFIGFEKETGDPDLNKVAFILTVSGEETSALKATEDSGAANTIDEAATADTIEAAILDLPSVAAGVTVAAAGSDNKVTITFAGADNFGDQWAVSGRVVNKPDAAIVAYKTTPGVKPGEPIISADRGWPSCGCIFQQRLLLGGFRSAPYVWMGSQVGKFYNFDDRLTDASGPFVIPMDTEGGENVVHLVPNRNLLVFTTEAEYWISDRALSRSEPPVHVQASRHGARQRVPVCENEGAALYVHATGSVAAEFRYTDIDGNFTHQAISLLASHLVNDVVDLAVQKAADTRDGNIATFVEADGKMSMATLLREQEVTAFTRVETPGQFRACSRNRRNELTFIVQRVYGGSSKRSLERFEKGLLLDDAQSRTLSPPSAQLTGLPEYEGQTIWVLADGHVLGPFTVVGGKVTLNRVSTNVTYGRWSPPVVTLVPFIRLADELIEINRPMRIPALVLSLEDTTSIAIKFGPRERPGKTYDQDLRRYGATADMPELNWGYTGIHRITGIEASGDRPTITLTQVRPGRFNVRSVTVAPE